MVMNKKQLEKYKILNQGIGEHFGFIRGEIYSNTNFLEMPGLKTVGLKHIEEIIEQTINTMKEAYGILDSIKSGLTKANKGLAKRFKDDIKKYELAHKDLCFYLATQKPWGQK